MTDIQTTVENARAQYHYPPIRSAILPSEADDLQLRLADRLHRHPHQHALEVIADLGRVFDAEDAEPAIEALGRLLVHASLLAGCERMAIAPVILLGRELTRDSSVSNELPLRPAAMLAWAALGRSHDDAAIVRGLAMAIAKAIDDVEIVHELKVDPLELFKVAAREVLDGKPVIAATAPAVQPAQPDKAAQRALAWTELRKASEAVVADELKQVPDGEPVELEPAGTFAGIDRSAAPFSLQNLPPQRPLSVEMIRDAVDITLKRWRRESSAPPCPACGSPMSPCSDSPGAWHCPKHP